MSMAAEDDYIAAPVRAKLSAIGIPRARQVRAELVGLFPKDLNVGATRLSADDIARVLVHLVEKNVFSIPGDAQSIRLKQVGPGWHFCHFYRDADHLLDIIAPYFVRGLGNGEACLWVLPDSVTRKTACQALAKSVNDVDGFFRSGQLEMLSHTEWYLDTHRKLKTFEEVAAALLAKQDRALSRGFKFLRAAGDTGWVSGSEESKNFIDYEMKINEGLKATNIAAVCTYRADASADELIAIVKAHQDALDRQPAFAG